MNALTQKQQRTIDTARMALRDAEGDIYHGMDQHCANLLAIIDRLTSCDAAPQVEGLTADIVYNHIKHGDEKHQAWLRAEVDKLFATPEPPAPTEAAWPEADESKLRDWLMTMYGNPNAHGTADHAREIFRLDAQKLMLAVMDGSLRKVSP